MTRCRITHFKGKTLKPHWAMTGCPVCYQHGGNLPQVRRRAQQRLAQAQLPEIVAATRRVLSGNASPADLAIARRAYQIATKRSQ